MCVYVCIHKTPRCQQGPVPLSLTPQPPSSLSSRFRLWYSAFPSTHPKATLWSQCKTQPCVPLFRGPTCHRLKDGVIFPLCSSDYPFPTVVVTVLSWQRVCSYSFYNHLPASPRVKDEMLLSPAVPSAMEKTFVISPLDQLSRHFLQTASQNNPVPSSQLGFHTECTHPYLPVSPNSFLHFQPSSLTRPVSFGLG